MPLHPVDRSFDPQHPLAHIGKKIWIGVLLSGLVVLYYVSRYSKGEEVLDTLLAAGPGYLLAMLAIETLYLFLQGGIFKGVYRAVGFARTLPYLASMYTCMNLVNTVAPVAGLSGSIYMMYFEKQRGLSRSDTLLINYLYYLTDYLVFLAVLLLGLAYLLVTGEATRTIIVTSLIFALFCAGVLIGGVFIFSHPTALHRLVSWLNRFAGRVLRRKSLISEEATMQFATEARQAWTQSHNHGRHLATSAAYAFLLHASCLLMLWLAFQAIHLPISLQILTAGYTVATLLNIVSPTPGGIGVAEGGMTAVFSAFGVPVGEALVVSLLYRVAFTWYPLILGLPALHFLPRLADKQVAGRVY